MEAQGNCRIAFSVSPWGRSDFDVFFVSRNELLWGKRWEKHEKTHVRIGLVRKTFWKLILEMFCTIFARVS